MKKWIETNMDLIKKLFKYNKNKKVKNNHPAEKESLNSNKKIIENLLSIILNDEYLSTPIYLHGVNCEEQDHEFGNSYPLQYVWNEYKTDKGQLGFSFSINGRVIGSMLEEIIPRTNPCFSEIRDEIMSVLSRMGKKSVFEITEKSLLPPSEWLKNYEYSDMINLNLK